MKDGALQLGDLVGKITCWRSHAADAIAAVGCSS
jgi:hypothetical protein